MPCPWCQFCNIRLLKGSGNRLYVSLSSQIHHSKVQNLLERHTAIFLSTPRGVDCSTVIKQKRFCFQGLRQHNSQSCEELRSETCGECSNLIRVLQSCWFCAYNVDPIHFTPAIHDNSWVLPDEISTSRDCWNTTFLTASCKGKIDKSCKSNSFVACPTF